jgi:hypothetical protein
LDGIERAWDWYEFNKHKTLVDQKQQYRSKVFHGKKGLEGWFQAMDWSHLHTLGIGGWAGVKTEGLTHLSRVAPPSLLNLTLSSPESPQAALKFISNLSRPLEALSLQNMEFSSFDSAMNAVAKEHGESLRSLAIHKPESEWKKVPPPITYKAAQLSNLLSSFPKLLKLDIDIPRDNSTTESNASTVAKLKNYLLAIHPILAIETDIEHLIVHYPSIESTLRTVNTFGYSWKYPDTMAEGEVDDPLLRQSNIRSLFQTLRMEKKGKELKQLDVYVGNWEGRHAPRELLARDIRRVAWWICEIDEDGKEVCKGKWMRNDE